MVRLRAPAENVGQVVAPAQGADLRQRAAALRVDGHRQGARPHDDFPAPVAVGVAVGHRERLADDGRQRDLGLQQGALHRAPQVRQIAAAEHAVPVRVVGLAAPEGLARLDQPAVVGTLAAGALDRAREPLHLPVELGDLGILHQEVPPEPAAQEAGEPGTALEGAEVALRLLQRPPGVLRQRPLSHLLVGRRRQVDAAGRPGGIDHIGERRRPQPRRGQHTVEEPVEPALFVHQPVCARPAAELLAVVDHRHRRQPAAPLAEVLDRLVDVGERDEVTQALVDREHAERLALLLGEVVPAEVLGLEAGQREVAIVDEDVLDARLVERARQVRLPHALGQPHAARPHTELGLEELAQALDLPALVGVGQDRQDGLVEATGEELDPAAGDDLPEQVEGRAGLGPQPVQEAARAVHRHSDLRPGLQAREERMVGPLGRLAEDAVEVSDRLMVVNAEAEGQGCVAHVYSRSMSRCTTVASRPSRSMKVFSSSTSATERCRPPVQPMATVR